MSKIDDQIKELQLKKKKIEFLNHILKSAKDYKHKDFDDIKESVIEDLEKFVTNAIVGIENGSGVNWDGLMDQNDLAILKTMVNKVKNRPAPTPKNQPYNNSSPEKKKPVADPNDKLSFALNNRHLANKRVTVANDQNMQVQGEVVGLDAPNVVVRTDAGPTINVPIDKVSPIN